MATLNSPTVAGGERPWGRVGVEGRRKGANGTISESAFVIPHTVLGRISRHCHLSFSLYISSPCLIISNTFFLSL
ncbi:hypothetical protein L2E82_32921 [Cichorium intybus]|uniref:Uncharacterized protein n=1 Tax=Cichorium intybus TaxID=13427 RepID=A0ACB9BID7_CICIN|nr:hypothetical protein L2E82_32921 [Cichorium intybus]